MNRSKKRKKKGVMAAPPLPAAAAYSKNKLQYFLAISLALYAFLLYASSINSGYLLDDTAAIVQNSIVTKGLNEIPTLFKTDYWYGFSEGIRVPQYRPASLVMFAMEWHFSPNNPHLSHFINVFLYSSTCFLLFMLLCNLFENKNLLFPFLCVLLYTAHPIHSEVVNNIKSRDEILCFIFGILSALFFIRFYTGKNILLLIPACLFFFLSLVSKESGIVFLIVIPLMLYFFKTFNSKNIGITVIVLMCISSIYFLIRQNVVGSIPIVQHFQLIDNSLIGCENYSERLSTAFYVLLQYFKLLIFPYPLSYDYSYHQVTIQSVTSPLTILSFLIFLFMSFSVLLGIQKRKITAFAYLFFFTTFAPVSNIFLLIGSTMAERFMYVPSLAFCIIFSLLLMKLFRRNTQLIAEKNTQTFLSSNSSILLFTLSIVTLLSIIIIKRNNDWKDNLTLFERDAKTVNQSARVHYNLGSALMNDRYSKATNEDEKNKILFQAKTELGMALSILPEYHDVSKELARLHFLEQEFEKAINESNAYLKYDKTKNYIYNIRGASLFNLGRYQEAIPDFQKALELDTVDLVALKNLGKCYGYIGQYAKAIECFQKGIKINPADADYNIYITKAYQLMGESKDGNPSIEILKK